MNRQKAKKISAAIEAAMKSVEVEFGVKIEVSGGTFDAAGFKPRVQISEIVDGQVVTPELTALRVYYPDAEGREISLRGERFKVIGYRPRATKMPFVVEAMDGSGKTYVCGPDPVLGRADALCA